MLSLNNLLSKYYSPASEIFIIQGANRNTFQSHIAFYKTDCIESGQLAAQVGDEDDDDWLLVAALLEELVDGDSGLSVGGLFLHLFQLSEHLVCAASQPQQGCRVKTT